jgi:hypothetical protein
MTTHTSTPCETVIELYVQACRDLFSAYGLATRVERQDVDRTGPREAAYVSVLGATSAAIRLTSTLNIAGGLLAKMHPSGANDVTERELEDWGRELNNQLVGRLKNKLLRRGCKVDIGLPTLITGTDVSTVNYPDLDYRRYFFASAHGCLTACLTLLIDPRFAFTAVGSYPEYAKVVREGAQSLF